MQNLGKEGKLLIKHCYTFWFSTKKVLEQGIKFYTFRTFSGNKINTLGTRASKTRIEEGKDENQFWKQMQNRITIESWLN